MRAATRQRRRWVPVAAAVAVIAVGGVAAVLGVLRHTRSDGTTSGATVASVGVSRDDQPARLLAASGVRQCADVPPTNAVPDRGRIRAAYRCTWAQEPEAVPGEGTFSMAVAQEVTSGLDQVLDLAEHAASQPPRRPRNEACALIGYVAEELWVTMDDGRVVRWQVPWAPQRCGGPSEAEERAWQGLGTRVVAKARGDQVDSALSLATGCGDGLQNSLTEKSSTAGTDSEPLSTPTVAGDATVCFYRPGADGEDVLQAGARLEQVQAHTLAALVGQSVRDETCPAGGRGTVALLEGFTVPGHLTRVLVDLDGCSVAAGFDGGWWRAPQALRDALARVQASAVRDPAPSKP